MKSLLTFTLLGVLGAALPASAATIQATYKSYYGGTVEMNIGNVNKGRVGGGVFSFLRTGGDYTDGPELDANDYFLGMCIEPTQSIGANQTHIWDVRESLGTNPGGDFIPSRAGRLTELFGRHWDDFTVNPLTKADALTLQLAVWEVVAETSDTLDVTQGNILFANPKIDGTFVASILTSANSWLSGLNGDQNFMADGLRAMVKAGVQDYAIQIDSNPPQEVPEPTHLLAGGLLILLSLRKRLG